MHRKNWFLAGLCALALPLTVVATAYACGSLATLKLNRATATPDVVVRAVGGNFNSNARASTVQLRFNGRNGRVLWEGRPAANGRFVADFTFPNVGAGSYVILATQTGPDGRPAAGTPGRAPLKVRKASSDASAAVAAWPPPQAGGPIGPQAAPVSPPLLAGIGVLALSLLAGGVAFVRRGSRRDALRLAPASSR